MVLAETKNLQMAGETGTRLQIPELAEVYQEQIRMLHEKGGLAPKYAELSIIVGARGE